MLIKGVLVVASQSGNMWVGCQPAAKLALREMREVRCLSGVVVLNLSGEKLRCDPDADVIELPKGTPAYPAVCQQGLGDAILCYHADTPLVPAAVVEQCAEAVLSGGAAAAQTASRFDYGSVQTNFDRWDWDKSGFIPVLGVRAFRPSQVGDWGRFGLTLRGDFKPVAVTKKQGLSLADEEDLEFIQALEHSGRV